jgi:pimeloyl-ACP methyl ester carboxylesterase
MGSAVAIGLALAHPEKVRRLVLVATSGGLSLDEHATEDWCAEYRATFQNADPWVSGERPEFTADIAQIISPTLLIWGDQDPISPVSVGGSLHALLPDSHLRVLTGGTPWLAHDRPDDVAGLVIDHLGKPVRAQSV